MSTYSVPRKPRAFGYLCLPEPAEDGADRLWRQRIANYATAEGLSLLRVFVDDRDSDGEQFNAMLGALDQSGVTHLVVPGREHLGRAHKEAEWMVQHILSTRLRLTVHAIDDPAPAGLDRPVPPGRRDLDAERRSA
jgi:hypothetical protein